MRPAFNIGETCVKHRIAAEFGNPAEDLNAIGMVSQVCGSWRLLVRPDDSWFIADVEELQYVDRHADPAVAGSGEFDVQADPGEAPTAVGTSDGASPDDDPAGPRPVADPDQYSEF